ncbi:MAG: exodeoxyribonuclease VII large subunit [Gammaproteobacteria bacterium]|nr:MAG: exodeoxyribonuclease VII large subunit [Gammaproteobacteria bacterium]
MRSTSSLDGPPRTAEPTRRILTPSQLNAEAQVVLEESFGLIWLEGEVSNLARPGSGHWYFSLKDARAQVRCAMFKNRNTRVRFQPENGLKVLLRGRVSLYQGRGEFQVIVEHVEPAGEGALRLAFEQLRARLEAEGLFAPERKRPIPLLPRHLAIITSPTGAAIRDILTVLARRWPAATVTLLPSAVQGDAAPAELIAALARLGRWREQTPDTAPDLVIIGRGGGSLEDLWAFNDEGLARAIAACAVPVISAVGHEVDVAISDLVADLRAPTPSAAAELAVPDRSEWSLNLRTLQRRLAIASRRRQDQASERLRHLKRRLRHPGHLLRERAQRVDELDLRVRRALGRQLAAIRDRLRTHRRRLQHASPTGRLRRGSDALQRLHRRLHQARPSLRVRRERDRLEGLERRLERAATATLTRKREQQQRLAGTLNAFNPLAVVERGYAIVSRPDGTRFGVVIRDPDAVEVGETLHALLAGGLLEVSARGRLEED